MDSVRMNGQAEGATSGATEVQKGDDVRKILFVSVDTPLETVIQCDEEGARVVFEHEKGRFLELKDEVLTALSHETRIAYSVSKALNEKDDPENNEFQQRIKVGELRDKRKQFESEIRTTIQSSLATKKLQAFVGNGFSPYWSRPDKVEERLAKGYEIVKPSTKDVYAGVQASKSAMGDAKASDGHFEIRSKPGEPELVLMRIPNDEKKKLMAAKDEAAKRMAEGMTSVGRREIVAAGGRPVDGRDDLPWQDRK
jgi:hypothetical protein